MEHRLEVATTRVLRERSYGSLQGKKETKEEQEKVRELLQRYKNMTYEQRRNHKIVEDMESDEELLSRVFTFLRETAVGYPGKTILVVCHGNILRTMVAHLGLVDMNSATKVDPRNTGYLVVESEGADFSVKEMRDIEISEV